MNSSIDLNIFPLVRQGNNLISELPDLYAVTPPRRTARGRETDSLIIYLSLTGNSPLAPQTQTQLLEQLAQKFYKTPGSLTAALRTIVEALNLYLLDRNLHSTGVGRQGIGQLLSLALKADTIYIAQCGGVHAFVLSPDQTQHLYDPQSSGRGLGLSRNTPIRFLQVKLNAGDFMVLATNPSPDWSEASLTAPQGVEALSSLLLNTTHDFNAVIVQAQAGNGKLRILRYNAEAPEALPPVITPARDASLPETPMAPVKAAESPIQEQPPKMPLSEIAPGEQADQQKEDKEPQISAVSISGTGITEEPFEPGGLGELSGTTDEIGVEAAAEPIAREGKPSVPPSVPPITEVTAPPETELAYGGNRPMEPVRAVEPTPSLAAPAAQPRKERPAPRSFPLSKYWDALQVTLAPAGAAAWRALRSALGTIGSALLRLLKNMLPDTDVLQVPPYLLVFMAIAIPLVLSVVGGMIFLQRGRAQQYQIYYQQASEQAAEAASLTDPMEQRLALQAVIVDLDKAEYYTVTSQSRELRTRVTAQLDDLDAVKRLDYKQAIVGGLDSAVNVTRMIATTTDLYMLNGTQGNVLHAVMKDRGYEVDANFQCGPTYGPLNVGPLVDIVELPAGSFENASVLGLDANGNLLYCVVGDQPYSAAMAPPNTGFGEPSAIALDQGDLYVLDQKVNAVWIYRNIEVSQQPHLFFGESIPPMQDVIDLAVYNNDLFLLHADGHITKCTYSSLATAPTRCEDPYPYSDNRPGRTHGPVIADAVFNQIYFSSFPERSIYMLDTQNQSIYYFSVLLALQWQYQPATTLTDGKATSFAISPKRMAFLAVGNLVYYAAIP
jgi:hypothetical protein